MSQKSTRADTRRSGRAAIDRRTNPQVMTMVSANQATSAACLGAHVKGTMTAANSRQVFVLIVTVVGTVQGLLRKEAHRRRVRHREVDELVAVEADESVQASDDEDEENGSDKQPPRRHVQSVPLTPAGTLNLRRWTAICSCSGS